MDNGNNPNPEVDAALAQSPTPLAPPACPYCSKSPAMINSAPIQLGNAIALVFSCGYAECRKIFNVQITGEVQPKGPSLVRPPAGFRPKPQ